MCVERLEMTRQRIWTFGCCDSRQTKSGTHWMGVVVLVCGLLLSGSCFAGQGEGGFFMTGVGESVRQTATVKRGKGKKALGVFCAKRCMEAVG